MNRIYPKDLNKGDRVLLKNGWYGTVKGKARGIRILLEVEGLFTEIGDVYTRDLHYLVSPVLGRVALIQLEEKHRKQFENISAAGF